MAVKWPTNNVVSIFADKTIHKQVGENYFSKNRKTFTRMIAGSLYVYKYAFMF